MVEDECFACKEVFRMEDVVCVKLLQIIGTKNSVWWPIPMTEGWKWKVKETPKRVILIQLDTWWKLLENWNVSSTRPSAEWGNAARNRKSSWSWAWDQLLCLCPWNISHSHAAYEYELSRSRSKVGEKLSISECESRPAIVFVRDPRLTIRYMMIALLF